MEGQVDLKKKSKISLRCFTLRLSVLMLHAFFFFILPPLELTRLKLMWAYRPDQHTSMCLSNHTIRFWSCGKARVLAAFLTIPKSM